MHWMFALNLPHQLISALIYSHIPSAQHLLSTIPEFMNHLCSIKYHGRSYLYFMNDEFFICSRAQASLRSLGYCNVIISFDCCISLDQQLIYSCFYLKNQRSMYFLHEALLLHSVFWS